MQAILLYIVGNNYEFSLQAIFNRILENYYYYYIVLNSQIFRVPFSRIN